MGPAWLFLGFALGCAPRPPDRPTSPEDPRPSPSAIDVKASSSADALVAAPPAEESIAPPEVTSPTADATAIEPTPLPVSMRVGFEKAVWVLQGKTTTPIIYLHGRCGDPKAFTAFSRAAASTGTLVSFVGDQACKDGSRSKWSGDVVGLDKRITRTLAHLSGELKIDLTEAPRIAMGYSQGALMAEALGTRFPERYPRVVLIGGPRAPKPQSLEKSAAILFMAGDKDARLHLRDASNDFKNRGKNARYTELPGARHGEYGEEAERVMREAFDWLLSPAAP